jgi:hypothetical protein
MTKKIIKVDLNFPGSEPDLEENEEQNDDYTNIKEDIAINEPPNDPPPPKPKRKPPTKKVNIEPVITEPVVEPVVEEVVESVVEPVVESSKELQKVKCQHCNKEMTMKSLKYSHSKNCSGLKKTIEKVRSESNISKVKQRESSPEPTPQAAAPEIIIRKKAPQNIEQTIPQPQLINPKVARMNALKDKYNNLVKNAFN